MKHTKKTALTAAVLTAAMSLVSCTGGDEDMQTVYGPPPTSYEPSSEEMQEVYGPVSYTHLTLPMSRYRTFTVLRRSSRKQPTSSLSSLPTPMH